MVFASLFSNDNIILSIVGFDSNLFSPYDKKSDIWNCIEDQKEDFEHSKKRIKYYFKGIFGDLKPFAMDTIYQVQSKEE
jgi:hypothetical protein